MKKQSKIFSYLIILPLVLSIFFAIYRIYIHKDYYISAEVSCDNYTESCFTYENDDGEIEYYKIITKYAKDIPKCDPYIYECEELFCENEDSGCFYTTCEDDNEDEIECSLINDNSN